MILPAALAKFAALGAVAKAATVTTVAVAAVGGAGIAGALPGPAQDAFDTVAGVDETAEQSSGEVTEPVTQPVAGGETQLPQAGTDAEAFDAGTWAEGPDAGDYSTFGAWVSEGAQNKDALKAEDLRFGAIVSEKARQNGMDQDQLADELEGEGLDLGDVTDGETEATDGESETGDAATADDSKASGKGAGKVAREGSGNGSGKGRGND